MATIVSCLEHPISRTKYEVRRPARTTSSTTAEQRSGHGTRTIL